MRGWLVWMHAALLLAVTALPTGCAKDEARGSVFGSWCRKRVAVATSCTGNQTFYVEIAAAEGDAITGVHCEYYGKECYELIDTEQTDSNIRYAYEFGEYRVEADLGLTQGGDALEGELSSTKCGGCRTPVTLYRIPE